MGYAYATADHVWALFNNPGGLGMVKETAAMAGFDNRYGIAGLGAMSAGLVTALPIGTAGISVFRFGDEWYSEQIASLNIANTFGIAALGLRANYLQYTIEGLGTRSVVSVDAGGVARLSETVRVGAYIRNVNQASVSEMNEQRAPTLLYAGISIRPGEKVQLAVETEKDIEAEAVLKAGLEYHFMEKFSFRTGIRTNAFTHFFGFGFIVQRLSIDYAIARDNVPGLSHQASVSYSIRSRGHQNFRKLEDRMKKPPH